MRRILVGLTLALALTSASTRVYAEENAADKAASWGSEKTFGVKDLGSGRYQLQKGDVNINIAANEWRLSVAPLDSVEVDAEGRLWVISSLGRYQSTDSLMLKTPKGQAMYLFEYNSNQGAAGICSGWELGRVTTADEELFKPYREGEELPDYSSLLASAPSKAHAFGTTPAAPETVNYGFRVVDGKKLSEAELEAQRKAAEAKGYKPTTRKLVIK